MGEGRLVSTCRKPWPCYQGQLLLLPLSSPKRLLLHPSHSSPLPLPSLSPSPSSLHDTRAGQMAAFLHIPSLLPPSLPPPPLPLPLPLLLLLMLLLLLHLQHYYPQ